MIKNYTFIAMLILATLLGCRPDKDNADGRVKLVLATHADDTVRIILLSAIKQFELEHPEIDVQLIGISGDYYQKLLVMIAGRTAPDLFWMGQSFAEFAVHGAFLDINDQITAEIDLSEYPPQVLNWYRINGRLNGLPYAIDTEFIAYNKKLFDEAGVAYPKNGWTIAEFTKTARKLTIDRDGDGFIDQYGYRGTVNYSTFGGAFLAKDGSRALCDSPEMLEAIKFNLDLVYKWKVAPTPNESNRDSGNVYSIFRQGKTAMMQFCTWNIPGLQAKCAEVDWDIVGVPIARRPAHWASSAAYLISSDTKHPAEAWLLLKKLLSDEFQMQLARSGIPANQRLARKMAKRNDRKPANLSGLHAAVNYLYPNPRVAHLQEILQHYVNAREKVFNFYGTSRYVPPEQAMAEAARRINQTIKRRKGKR